MWFHKTLRRYFKNLRLAAVLYEDKWFSKSRGMQKHVHLLRLASNSYILLQMTWWSSGSVRAQAIRSSIACASSASRAHEGLTLWKISTSLYTIDSQKQPTWSFFKNTQSLSLDIFNQSHEHDAPPSPPGSKSYPVIEPKPWYTLDRFFDFK